MTRILFSIVLAATFLQLAAVDASAGWRCRKCEACGDYKPPKGVIKWFTCRVSTDWEYRQHCLPCGRKEPYKVKVITYRDRYSDGSSRTWKCVVAGTEIMLGQSAKTPVYVK